MSTTWRLEVSIESNRELVLPTAEVTLSLRGKEYSPADLASIDWDEEDQNTFNDVDMLQCR